MSRMRSVRRMVRCEGIVSLAIPCSTWGNGTESWDLVIKHFTNTSHSSYFRTSGSIRLVNLFVSVFRVAGITKKSDPCGITTAQSFFLSKRLSPFLYTIDLPLKNNDPPIIPIKMTPGPYCLKNSNPRS